MDARIIRNGDVGRSGRIKESLLPVRSLRAVEFGRARVAANDIVITTSGNCGEVAYVECDPEVPTAASNFVRLLRVDQSRAFPRYLFHLLRTQRFRRTVERFTRGATIKNLSVENALRAFEIPVPPLPEQRRIAAILDRAEAIHERHRSGLDALTELTAARFRARFAEHRTATATVMDVLRKERDSIRTGPFGSDLLHSEFVGEGVPVLGIDNVVQNRFVWAKPRYITDEKYLQLRRYQVHEGDVLISIMGTVGRCAIVPIGIGPAINTKHLCCITLDQSVCLPEFLQGYFLYHPIARDYLRRTSKGAIMDGLNMGIIKQLPLALPHVDAQREYVDEIDRISSVKERIEDRNVNALFASLEHRAFRGEL